eukprot:TRINITY_DN7421_c0_g1_i1.p1 TRINITY_DN7421_c0_g1~~TRINITY_DN7421_c0_g1_i1.p1  ORF type:complete len:338 (-),score=80.87 TRINITY_DN7421_c0_g1_i1:244-1257(-)
MSFELKVVSNVNLGVSLNVVGWTRQGHIVVGTSEANIIIYQQDLQKEIRVLESKGGSICSLLVHNVTKFSEENEDIIVGDAEGNVVIFSNNQILSKYSFGSSITELVIHVDPTDNMSIVAGDSSGTLNAFGLHSELLYRVKISEDSSLKGYVSKLTQGRTDPPTVFRDPAVRSIASLSTQDQLGNKSNYLVVSDGNNFVYYVSVGTFLNVVGLPAPVSQIVTGFFTQDKVKEVLVGCEDGMVYLLEAQTNAFKRWMNVGYKMTKLVASKRRVGGRSVVFCVGQFNALKVLHGGKVVLEHMTSDWVHCIAVRERSEMVCVALGQVNGNVSILELVLPK